MAQKVFKSTNGLIPMDYAAVYREKHIKGMLDRRILGDKEVSPVAVMSVNAPKMAMEPVEEEE